ncbi:MAG: tRNA (guanosine(46)-N7)-methyltransferase TrmB [Gammaproteobacteria bacterium]|nr:tRNA (guanosine(46)-N7)-methyltransferase TrmB [Gammaproteobacteria bacterium]
MTSKQRLAIETHLPQMGLAIDAPWDFNEIFGRVAPTVVEIGFGMGDSLFQMALAQPDENFIGIEVHPPGVGALLTKIAETGIENLRVCSIDAIAALEASVADGSLARVQLFFPDPWPKKRHHKRRIVRPDFISLIERKLQNGGIFHIATDWADYAESITELMQQHDQFQRLNEKGHRAHTKYEGRANRLGLDIFDLVFQRL